MTAAAMWAANGSIARFLLDDGVSAARLSQLRSAGAFVLLLAAVTVVRRDLLRIDRRDFGRFAFLGVAGLALVHAAYFAAIDRLEIGVALTIQYLGPVLLLLWLRFAHGRRLHPRLWGAVALSVIGCFLVVRAYDAADLDTLGVVYAFAAAVTFAFYMVGSELAGRRYEPATTLLWGFGFASVFWAVVQPWWAFPFDDFASADALLQGSGVIVVGTLIPFLLIVTALRQLPAPRVAVVATLEPVLAAVFAWIIHAEALAAVQIAGGCLVITAVAWVQSQRPDLEQEGAPPLPLRPKRG